METKKVLVAGATGYLGGYLVKELKRQGYWVRVLVRKETQKEMFDTVDDVFVGQVTDKESLRGVAEGIDWVFTTIGITRQKDGLTYMDVDYQGNRNLLDEALQAYVDKFLYVSAINGDKLRDLKIFEAKERFVDDLKNSGLNYTIVRPNGFFSDMTDFLKMGKAGSIYLFGDGNLKLNPIHGADLAAHCLAVIQEDEKESVIGGPDLFSQNELGALALNVLGKKERIIHLPDWVRRFVIWVLRSFTSVKTYGPIEFFLTAMAIDNSAPVYGTHHLRTYYEKLVNEGNI